MSKKLYRSSTNKVLGGVCGGIGDYFNIDPVIVRLLVIVFTLMGGSGFVAYLIAYVIIPSENAVMDKSMGGAAQSSGNVILKWVLTGVIIMMGLALAALIWSIFRWTLGSIFHGFLF